MPKQIYFAGPLFTQAEWQWNKELARQLRNEKLIVLLPQETAQPMLQGVKAFDAHAIFAENLRNVEKCDCVMAILDQPDPDSGTCWECGYAYGLKKPIIGLRTDLRGVGDDPNSGLNLMLSQSCRTIIKVPPAEREDVKWIANQIRAAITNLK